MNIDAIQKLASGLSGWTLPRTDGPIPQGDMPGDKVQIGPEHIAKANTIFPLLVPLAAEYAHKGRVVISVCGGSGVGKSEIASLLSHYFRSAGIGSYTLVRRQLPPAYPHVQRRRAEPNLPCRRSAGSGGRRRVQCFRPGNAFRAVAAGDGCRPALRTAYPWLAVYQDSGRAALAAYLGTDLEQDYNELNGILSEFHAGAESIWLKRMGRTEDARWYDAVDLSDTNVLILEWTHGNSDFLHGVDIPILLNSTPEQTRAHRRSRSRDGKTDSAFTTMVLEIEQAELDRCAHKAKIILAKTGENLTYAQYRAEMEG